MPHQHHHSIIKCSTDCAIKADICPTDPLTIISIPFIEIPHLELASPSIIKVPP